MSICISTGGGAALSKGMLLRFGFKVSFVNSKSKIHHP